MHGISALDCCHFYGSAVPRGASGDEQHSWPSVRRGTASGRVSVVGQLLGLAVATCAVAVFSGPVPQWRSGAALPGFVLVCAAGVAPRAVAGLSFGGWRVPGTASDAARCSSRGGSMRGSARRRAGCRGTGSVRAVRGRGRRRWAGRRRRWGIRRGGWARRGGWTCRRRRRWSARRCGGSRWWTPPWCATTPTPTTGFWRASDPAGRRKAEGTLGGLAVRAELDGLPRRSLRRFRRRPVRHLAAV